MMNLRRFFLIAFASLHSQSYTVTTFTAATIRTTTITTTTTTTAAAMMKAWSCHGRTQLELVTHLTQASIISSPEIATVMTRVDRSFFTPTHPYQDAPQPIAERQTISAPHMHAHVLERLLPRLLSAKPPLTILDVGCGSGYLTACFAELLKVLNKANDSQIYGIDVWPNLIDTSQKNIQQFHPELLTSHSITLSLADGWLGLPGKTFDAIHVGAAATEFPKPLLMQLKLNGVLIIPVGPQAGVQVLYQVERLELSNVYQPHNFLVQEVMGVRYVPLIHPQNSQDGTTL